MLRRYAVFLPVLLVISSCGFDPTLETDPQVSIRITSEIANEPRLLSAIDELYADQRSSFAKGMVPSGGRGTFMYRIKGNGFEVIGESSPEQTGFVFSFYTRRAVMFGDRDRAFEMAGSMCTALKQVPGVSVGVVEVLDRKLAERSTLFQSCGQTGTDRPQRNTKLGDS